MNQGMQNPMNGAYSAHGGGYGAATQNSALMEQFYAANQKYRDIQLQGNCVILTMKQKQELITFRIEFNKGYPEVPPIIHFEGGTIFIPIIQWWNPAFNLTQIIDECLIYGQRRRIEYSIKPSDVEKFLYSSHSHTPLRTQEDVMAALDNMQDIKTARKNIETINQSIRSFEEQKARKKVEIERRCNEIASLFEDVATRLSIESNNDQGYAQLQQYIADARAHIECLGESLHNKRISIDQYLEEVAEVQKRMAVDEYIYNNL